MQYDVYFIFNYWRNHRRKAAAILFTYVLLIIFVFASFSMIRTELRRIYFDNFNYSAAGDYHTAQGAYSMLFCGLGEEDAGCLADEPCVGLSGRLYTGAYLGNESCAYTYGAYMDDAARELSGIPFLSGGFPQEAGEVAVSELAMANMGMDAGVGDTVTMAEYDSGMEVVGMRTFKLAGIFGDDGTRRLWETNPSAVAETADKTILEPVILLSPGDMDTESSLLCVMVRWAGIHDSLGELPTDEDYEPYRQVVNSYLEKARYGRTTGGYDSSYFADSLKTEENPVGGPSAEGYTSILKSDKSRFYEYACITAAIVMALSLVCVLLAAMPGLLSSMAQLHRSGCPFWRLRRMFALQWVLFTLAGSVLGFVAAIGAYEAMLQVQHYVFGLGIYRAWQSEWGIRKITYSPAAMSVLFMLAASVAAFGIPVVFLRRMLAGGPKKCRVRIPVRTGGFHRCMGRVFWQPSVQALQALSMVLVLVVSCAALMFFSVKGKSGLDPHSIAQGQVFETDLRLDMRRYGIDCTVQNTKPTWTDVRGMIETADMEDGMEDAGYQQLLYSGKFTECYAWADIGSLFAYYPRGTHALKGVKPWEDGFFAPGEREAYGMEEYDVYDIGGAVMVSGEMAMDSGLDKEALDQGGVAIIYGDKEPFGDADTIPLFSAYGGAQFTDISDILELDVAVSGKVQLDQGLDGAGEMLNGIWGQYVQNCGYVLVFTRAGAQKLGLHYRNYNHVYLGYAEGTADRDVRELLRGVNLSRSHIAMSTLTQNQERYNRIMLKEFVVVYTIFGLFILLALAGYFQALKVQVMQRRGQVATLRALGGSKQRVRNGILLQLMKAPAVSCALGAAGVVLLRRFLEWRYGICERLYSYYAEFGEDPTNPIRSKAWKDYVTQQAVFLTRYEMWKVPVAGLFICLAVLTLVCIFIFSYITASRVADAPILPEREE